jgi:hypothetical protein
MELTSRIVIQNELADAGGVEVSLISLPRLKENKKASGRSKDVTDLENLP